MAKADVRAALIEALEPAAAERGMDLVDVELAGATKAPVVRVRIDNLDEGDGSISLDEVAAASEWVSAVVEELDPFPGSYTLEVSSPGLDRPLRRPADFERFAGEEVAVKMAGHEGRRNYTGELLGFFDGCVRVKADDETFDLPLDGIQSVHVKPVF